jgi:broad specificity polyphosphatase/5'/3'-nucleotidase SurE
MKTVAFSGDFRGHKMIEAEFEKTFKYVLDNDLLSDKYSLNVNFPRESQGVSKGIKFTELFFQKYVYNPEINNDKYLPNRTLIRTEVLPLDSDAFAIRNGYTSISKLSNK